MAKKSPKVWIMLNDENDVIVGSSRKAVRNGGNLKMVPPCYSGFLAATRIRLDLERPVAIRVVKCKS